MFSSYQQWFWLGVALEHLGVALCKSGVAPTTPFIYKVTHVSVAHFSL